MKPLHEFNNDHRRPVTAARTKFHNARIAALAILVARRNVAEQLLQRILAGFAVGDLLADECRCLAVSMRSLMIKSVAKSRSSAFRCEVVRPNFLYDIKCPSLLK
jgi:hypothetical protein